MRDRSRLLITAAVLAVVVAIGAGLAFDGAAKGELCGGSFGPCPPKKPPKAKLRTPGAVKRGDTVRLDASDSSGTIDNYTFHFTLGPGCPDDIRLTHDSKDAGDDPTTRVKLLCSLKVTVTVKGDGKEDTSSSVVAKVKARKLDPITVEPNDIGQANLPFADIPLYFGGNRSAEQWSEDGMDFLAQNRWIDPGPDYDGTNGAVDMQQLDDADGPFDGLWYVTADHLKFDRIIIINSKLLPGGSVYVKNQPRYASSLEKVVDATRQHELFHGELAEAALGDDSINPLKDLEKSIANDQDALLRNTNQIISDAEDKFAAASSENKVHAKMTAMYGGQKATIFVPTDLDATSWTKMTFTLATVGDGDDPQP